MPDALILKLAEDLLDRAPAGVIGPAIADSLLKPTPRALHDAALALLSGDHLDAAEPVFRALLEQAYFGARGAVGLASIAAKRGDPQAACAAWRECLDRFAVDAQPFWYVELARAERQCGDHSAAEASLRKCTGRFPTFAPAAADLAKLLWSMGRPAEAVDVWRTAIRNGSDKVQPWWILDYAAALRAAGQGEQPDALLEDMYKRFSEEPTVLAFQARGAASGEDWTAALDLWTRCIDRKPAAAEPEWLNGRAMALFRLWRAEEALQVWQELIARHPDFIRGYTEMASSAAELGRWETADQCWSTLIARFPEFAEPEWIARRAMGRLYLVSDQSLDTAIADLDARFPTSPLGRRMAVRLACHRDVGLSTLDTLVEDAVARFPADRELLAQRVRVLLAHERFADAETVVRNLEADKVDHHGLISRWRLTMDRDGDDAIIESVRHVASGRSFEVSQALEIGEFLLSTCSPWSMKEALALFSDFDRRFPGRVAIAGARARTLIRLRQDQAALDLIESVPEAYESQDVVELRGWARARRGDVDGARRIWQNILERYHFRAVHGAEPNLELVVPARDEGQFGGVTAFASIRDEIGQLQEFLRHHRLLGVGRFVIVDNMSTDGTGAYLRAQPDVILYRTADNFQDSGCGMRWINTLIERHGAGGWCLFADADEAFVYPGWESTSLPRLTEYLNQEGAEAVSAFMLDVYPERLSDSAGEPATHADCRYYDGDYDWIGHSRPPYCRPLGGVRYRLFRAKEYLQKVPLIKSGRGVHIDNHDTTAMRFASVTGALLHYKMLDLRAKRDNPALNKRGNAFRAEGGLETARRYERYLSGYAAVAGVDLRSPKVSQTLTDSLALADRGLMHAPSAYLRWRDHHG